MIALSLACSGIALGVAAAVLVYLASPNQRLLPRAWPLARSLASAAAAAAASLVLLMNVLASATAVFVLVLCWMLVWPMLPIAISVSRHEGINHGHRKS